jgi:hypothetical protein
VRTYILSFHLLIDELLVKDCLHIIFASILYRENCVKWPFMVNVHLNFRNPLIQYIGGKSKFKITNIDPVQVVIKTYPTIFQSIWPDGPFKF